VIHEMIEFVSNISAFVGYLLRDIPGRAVASQDGRIIESRPPIKSGDLLVVQAEEPLGSCASTFHQVELA